MSLAANCHHKENLAEARRRLGQILFNVHYTDELWTEPFGGRTPSMYLNQLVYATTSLSLEQLTETLKQTELDMGRNSEERRKGIVCIDLDLMLFDGVRHHLRDWERPYIQALLKNDDDL